MKTLFTFIALGLFSAAIVGCEANARVGDPDTTGTSSHSEVKKTTTVTPSGDTVKTETRIER